MAQRSAKNISAIIKDLFHSPPSYKTKVIVSWRPLDDKVKKLGGKFIVFPLSTFLKSKGDFLTYYFPLCYEKFRMIPPKKKLNVWSEKTYHYLSYMYYKIFSGTMDNSKMNCHLRPVWNDRIFFTSSDFSSLKILSSKVPIYAMVVCLQTFKNNVISRSMTCT